MLSRITLCLMLGLSLNADLHAQALPEHPSKLTFKPITFEAPKAKDARIKLKNSITAYLVNDPTGQPMVELSVVLKAGSYLDPAGKEGLTSLTLNQIRAGGSIKTPSEKLDERLEFLSAEMNAFASNTQSGIYMDLMEKDAREGLNLLMECLRQPAFQQDRLDLAKKNTRQGIQRRNDDAASIERYQLEYVLRGENYYTSKPVTAASLDAIRREDLLAMHAKLLHPENFIVAVSGRFDKKAMTQLLNETLGTLKAGPKAEVCAKVPAPEFTPKPGIYTTQKDGSQGRVILALPGLKRSDADWHAVEVMNHILGGGGFASRLVNRIRSGAGLSYSVGSTFTPGVFYPGNFFAAFQTKNSQVPYGIRIAMEELTKIANEPVSEDELTLVKSNIVDGFPSYFDSKSTIANLFAQEDRNGAPDDFYTQYRAKIQAVTLADVQRVARKYLKKDNLVIMTVGDVKDMEIGDVKDHPGKLSEVAPLPVVQLPARDPLTMKPLT